MSKLKIWRIKSEAGWARSTRYSYLIETSANDCFGVSDFGTWNYLWVDRTARYSGLEFPPRDIYEVIHDAD